MYKVATITGTNWYVVRIAKQVDFNANSSYHKEKNWRLLQQAFTSLQIDYAWPTPHGYALSGVCVLIAADIA